MSAHNTLIPLARRSLAAVVERGGPVTADGVRAEMQRDVLAELTALDLAVALQRMETLAIREVLRDYGPAFASVDGYVHASDEDDLPVPILEQILALRERQMADDERALGAIRNRLAARRLRDGLEHGAPVDEGRPVA